MCLAPLERSRAGKGSDKTGGALGISSRQRSEDLPGSSTFWSFIAAGDFAGNHRGAQLTFGQIVSGLDALVIQKGKEMIALFKKSMAHGLFVGFAAGRLQSLNGFTLESLTQITKGLRAKPSFLLLECDGGAQH